jgi:hypothetical protein
MTRAALQDELKVIRHRDFASPWVYRRGRARGSPTAERWQPAQRRGCEGLRVANTHLTCECPPD